MGGKRVSKDNDSLIIELYSTIGSIGIQKLLKEHKSLQWIRDRAYLLGVKNETRELNLGDRIGFLEILNKEINPKIPNKTHYRCKCICGNEKLIRQDSLRRSNEHSCGCMLAKQQNKHHQKPKGYAVTSIVLSRYIAQAEARGLEWSISRKELEERIFLNCYYCGSPPIGICQSKQKDSIKYNGLDRINNSMGYTIDNVVTCCKICNRGKNNMSFNDFLTYTNQIVKYKTANNLIS